jgi:beta-glucosidase
MMDYDIRHGRTYMYFQGEPLYPFGYGLSYTTFHYTNLRLSPGRVSVDVKNTGSRQGDEVVQLYVKHVGSKVERPAKELRGFRRITLAPNQKTTLELELPSSSLAYWNVDQKKWVVEPDQIEVMVGGSSVDTKLTKVMRVP